MNAQQIEKFRAAFASIVYWKGTVKSQAAIIKRLESWNKGGSHDKAILEACDLLDSYRKILKEKLCGKSYDDWKKLSKTISEMIAKYKRAVNEVTKKKWKDALDNIQWDVLNENADHVLELKALKHIRKEIESSEYILKLEPNWDEDGALTISKNVWQASIDFLISASKTVLDNSNDGRTIKSPEINPCPNNSIDLSWRTKKARLLLNFRQENNMVVFYYYGDLYNNNSPIVGGPIELDKVPLEFINWMENYLK